MVDQYWGDPEHPITADELSAQTAEREAEASWLAIPGHDIENWQSSPEFLAVHGTAAAALGTRYSGAAATFLPTIPYVVTPPPAPAPVSGGGPKFSTFQSTIVGGGNMVMLNSVTPLAAWSGVSYAAAPMGGTSVITTQQGIWDIAALGTMWAAIEGAVMAFWNNGLVQKAVALVKSIFGVRWLAILAALAAAGIIAAWLYDWFKKRGRKKHRRLSIGSNPRIGTLIKVAKATDKLTKRFGTRMRHAGLIHQGSRHTYYPMRAKRDLVIPR